MHHFEVQNFFSEAWWWGPIGQFSCSVNKHLLSNWWWGKMTLRKMVNCTWVWIAFYQHFKPSGSKNRTVWHSFGKVHSIIGGQLELEQSLAISIGHQIIKDVHLSNLKIICQNISSSLLLLCVNAGQVLLCPKIYCSSLIFQNPSKMASLTKTPKQRLFWTPTKNTAEEESKYVNSWTNVLNCPPAT